MKLLATVTLLTLSWSVNAQFSGNLYYNQTTPVENPLQTIGGNNEIILTVSGLLNAEADTFVAFFNITQVGETAAKTDSLMNVRIQLFKETLSRTRKDSLQITTDLISFVPKYDLHLISKLFSKTYNEIPDGFEMQKNIAVRFHHTTDLDAIVSTAAKAEIYDLVKVDYFLKDVKSQYDKLRAQCMEVLKTKMKSIETLGVKTDTRKTFDEDFKTILPQTRYGSYVAAARPSLSSVKKSSGMGKISSADLSPSKYYDAVPYAAFDIVINPVISQPVVQLSYQASLKIILSPVEITNKDLFLITPNGALQKVETFYK